MGEIMNCKKCGANLPDDAEFCAFYGTKIVKEKYCPKCGYKCAENYLYCLKCGYKFEENPATASNETKFVSPRITNNETQNLSISTNAKKIGSNAIAFAKRKKSVLISIVCFMLSLMIFVSSFFGVITVNMSEDLLNITGDTNIHLARNINADLSSIDLIKYSLFAISLDEEKANNLKNEYDTELNRLTTEFALAIAPYVSVTTDGTSYLSKKGCEKAEEFLQNTDFLLVALNSTYLYSVLGTDTINISTSSIGVPLKTAGIFALLTIIVSGITLVVSILAIFRKNAKGLNVLLAFAFILSIIATSLAAYEKDVTMGAAYIFIMVIFALYYVVNMAVKIISEKQISLGTALSKSAVIVSSIVALAMFTSPVINVSVKSNDFANTNFEYTYDYTHFEICDSVFPQIPFDQRESGMDYNDSIEELLGKEDVTPLELKMYLGLNRILQNKAMATSTSVLALFIPIMSMLSLFTIAFLFAVNVATNKHTKLFNCITLVIITAFLLVSIVICYSLPGLIASIATFSFSAGVGLIVQLVFACIALVASIVALFMDKYVFAFGKKVQTTTITSLANNTISEKNVAQENDLTTTPLEQNASQVVENQQPKDADASTPNDLANG